MKVGIHPKYYPEAKAICACGTVIVMGSTLESFHIELCSNCHPFYTGEQKFVDSASRIQKFQNKQTVAKQFNVTKVKKQEEKTAKSSGPKTLAEMLAGIK